MTFHVACPQCGAPLDAAPSQAGWQIACPQCHAAVPVPPPPPGQSDAEPGPSDHPALLIPSRSGSHEDLIDMTAMVDIVFFLLIFFLITSMQALEAVISLPSPQAEESTAGTSTRVADLASDTANYITLIIDEENAVWLEGEEIHGEQNLRVKLRAARQQGERNGLLIIGDAQAHHGALVTVLDAGVDAGIDELVFSVREQADPDDG